MFTGIFLFLIVVLSFQLHAKTTFFIVFIWRYTRKKNADTKSFVTTQVYALAKVAQGEDINSKPTPGMFDFAVR
jgi:hypothetical protein